jgi:hypothetical protein
LGTHGYSQRVSQGALHGPCGQWSSRTGPSQPLVGLSRGVGQSTAPRDALGRAAYLGVLNNTQRVGYSQRRPCPPSTSAETRTRRALCGFCRVGLRHWLCTRLCACAAPTPAPTNLGDSNPPTALPRTYAPTLSPTLLGGARRAASMPTIPLMGPALCRVIDSTVLSGTSAGAWVLAGTRGYSTALAGGRQ